MPLPDVFSMIAKTAEWFSKPDNRGLDTFDRVFLRMGQLAENVGIGGDELKLYNRVVGRGDTSPVTEKDLSSKSVEFLSSVLTSANDQDRASRISTSGVRPFVFEDYNKHLPAYVSQPVYLDEKISWAPRVKMSDRRPITGAIDTAKSVASVLGRFGYRNVDSKTFEVTDVYDFNKEDLFKNPTPMVEKPISMMRNPMAYAADLGARLVPPGKGAPVKIKIPRKP